jgi:cystathionine beta-lyase
MTFNTRMQPDFDAITTDSLVASGSLKWTKYGPGPLGAFVAEMDFGTAPEVIAAVHEAVDRAQFGYLPPALATAMSDACARWQADAYGWVVDAADVLPLPDVIHGMRIAIEHLSRPGSPVILPVPAYMPFLDVPGRLGREVLLVEVVRDGDRYVYDLDALDRAFAAGGDLLILCNPHNPLGRVMDAAELDGIASVVDRHGGRVFADEIHAPITFPGTRHLPYASRSATAADHTVTATSASKAWNLAGMRCAQLILSNDADRAVLEALGPWATHGASTLGVVANTAAFAHGRPWLDTVVAYVDRNRHLLAELLATHLPAVRYSPPEGTYLAWLDCRALGLPQPLDELFLDRAGVALVDGARCGPPGAGFVRINIATTAAILVRIVEQMADALSP